MRVAPHTFSLGDYLLKSYYYAPAVLGLLALTAQPVLAQKGADKPSRGGKRADPAKAAPTAPDPATLIWPLPPDPPRIRWVAEFSDMAKIKPAVKKSAWLDKVTGTKTQEEKLELRKPYGVTTDSKGRIYIADTERKVVFMVDRQAKAMERREGNGRVPLAMPVGVAVDSQDRLFVSDAALHIIVCFSPTGEPIGHFGSTALGRPGGIAIDRTRNRLYIADAKESRIAVFDTRSMEFRAFIGAPSKNGQAEKGKFYAPTNVAVDRKGYLYVSDTWNYRIQILDPEGRFVRAFGTQGDRPGEFIRPKGVGVDSEGHIYVADAEFNNFQIFTPEGKPLLAVGALGFSPGQFALVAGLYIDSGDRIYTTEQFKGRLQVFQYIPQPGSSDSKEVQPTRQSLNALSPATGR